MAGKIAEECWQEKARYDWEYEYGRERERYYNRNGWSIEAWEVRNGEEDMEVELISREISTQRQHEEGKILKAKYNKRYKEISAGEEDPRYLRKENLEEISRGNEVKALCVW